MQGQAGGVSLRNINTLQGLSHGGEEVPAAVPFTEKQTEAWITEAICQGSWEHREGSFPEGLALRLFLTSTQPTG